MTFITNPDTLREIVRRGLNDNQVRALHSFLRSGLRAEYMGTLGIWVQEVMELFDCSSLPELWEKLNYGAGMSLDHFLIVEREATTWVR